ncbi:hypothetical protein M422DRAFT_269809 [Sphaerobolus stellatus SS14]|uniref:CCHC-type domain-containing protein n=1 Tax=Sphaerobolus stellatus (strain SS14) TaxID=990650 RepID=A0A0C9UU53_SPHS4|nr:hypothetical protein M422DRAFT_269809 [Sphaerobolus stellatus SS14]
MYQGSGSWQNLGDAPSEPDRVSPDGGDTDEEESFTIPASEVTILRQEYADFINLKDNAEIVLTEAMEAAERLNTVFNHIRTSMNRMSPRMKELFIVPVAKSSGKIVEPRNNRAYHKAAAKAATERIIAQTAINTPVPGTGTDDHARLRQSRVPHDVTRIPCHPDDRIFMRIFIMLLTGIPESIECSWCSIREPQSIDMNALREEIKETISATIKEKLCSDADSVTTVSQSMLALDANAQYWSDLSNKATKCSPRALELQLKMAEEKVNTLLHEKAPEEAFLEAAWEACNIRFQLDQNMHLREAGLMPEQQVRFSADTGKNIHSPSRNYGINPINEVHIDWPETYAPYARQSTPALSMTAQLDSAVVNMTSEYSGIQQMVRQAMQNASQEEEPEKSFLAKAGVKMGNPPTYSGECSLKKFENWVASVLPYMSMYNLLRPQAGKAQLQFLGQCLTDEAQEWFYHQKWFMLTFSLNKVAVNYDNIVQGSITVQQLHQELTKLAKQMIELPDVNPIRTAVKANNTVVCFNCNQPGHIRPNCPFTDKDRRVAGGSIEEIILEEDEGQIEEFDEYAPHPEEQQEHEDQPQEDDQQYRFDDDEYETRPIDNEVVHVNAVIKASGYNDHCRVYGITVQEAETDLRVSVVLQTGGKEQPVYDH